MSINFDIFEKFMKSLVSGILNTNQQTEIKVTLIILPSHIHNLKQWKEPAGDMAAGELFIADIGESFDIKGCRAMSWLNII